MAEVNNHYNEKYFLWQKPMGEFAGWANKIIFEPFIKPTDNVLEFGCGGGYLLKELNCKEKLGIEINKSARDQAGLIGVTAYESASFIQDEWADIIISTNALEHTLHPFQELQGLFSKLRYGGRIVFVVPCESIRYKYRPNDINQHLYSWSPMCIGNLFTEAGFKVEEVRPYIHKWPPFYKMIAQLGGRQIFDFASRVYGYLERSWFQIKIVGKKC